MVLMANYLCIFITRLDIYYLDFIKELLDSSDIIYVKEDVNSIV